MPRATAARGFMPRAAAALALAPLLAATGCGEKATEDAAPPEPVVIESPRARVLVGADTTLVFGPTIFAWFAGPSDASRPSAAALDEARDFQANVQSAEATLRAAGIRLLLVTEIPVILDVDPATDASAGPGLAGAPFGYVLVDAMGHLRRVTSRLDASGMVCAAAATFGLTLNAQQRAPCG
jgi:hypothetical protein